MLFQEFELLEFELSEFELSCKQEPCPLNNQSLTSNITYRALIISENQQSSTWDLQEKISKKDIEIQIFV